MKTSRMPSGGGGDSHHASDIFSVSRVRRRGHSRFEVGGGGELFKPEWVWKSGTQYFVRKFIQGLTLHACSGHSDIGDVRVDILPHASVTVVADVLHLPLREGLFDTVVCDPPWQIKQRFRKKLVYALHSMIRWRGQLILRATWLPWLPILKIEGIWVQAFFQQDVKLLVIARKESAQITEFLRVKQTLGE